MDHRWTLAGSALLLVALAVPGGSVQAAGGYTIEDLGPAELQTVALALNADGDVAGYGLDATFTRYGFGQDAAPFVLPSLGGPATEATAINAHGVLSGFSEVAFGIPHAITFDAATATLVDLDPSGPMSFGRALNDNGVVVGSALVGAGLQAVRWASGVRTDLGTLGGVTSQAWGINDAGVIVGDSLDASNFARAFRHTDATGMVPMDSLGGWVDSARAVNASGVAVGYASAPGGSQWRAVRWSAAGTIAELGTLGGTVSAAYGINSAGEIVGWSLDAAAQGRAFLVSGGVMVDLNSLLPAGSGWTLTHAYSINDAGQIVGAGVFEGRMRAFRLTPQAVEADEQAPAIAALHASPDRLWPPRHQMVDVSIGVDASDNSGETPTCGLLAVASSDPDNGTGDGDTANDIEIVGPTSVRLRAERSGSKVRTYTLTVECRDGAGNRSTAQTWVTVAN